MESVPVASKAIYFATDIVAPIAVGCVLARRARLSKAFFDRMMNANLIILGTSLSILTFWAIRPDRQLAWLPVLGVAMQMAAGLVGLPIALRRYRNPLEQGSYLLSAMLSNRGVVGTVTLFLLFGEAGYALNQLVMLLAPAVLYLVCFPLSKYFQNTHAGEPTGRLSFRSLLLTRNQVPFLGIVAGLALNLARIERPTGIEPVIQWSVHLTAWLFLVPVGAAMNFDEMRRYWRHTVDLLPVKFVITPLATWALAWAVGLEGLPLHAVLIASLSPTAINAVITARLYRLNVHLAVAAFVLTHITYVALIFPLILALAPRIT